MTKENLLGGLFDSASEFLKHEHFRPHWSQAGVIVFITFRTADSIPKEVLQRWEREKRDWLQRHGCDASVHWSLTLPTLDRVIQDKFHQQFNRCREDFLDTCFGDCVLRDTELAELVADALLYTNGKNYCMGDFVVMPNHVHLLASFPSEESMVEQCDSWLHYSAFKINKSLGRKGKFWQQEPFDHLVRSVEQYEYLRDYIENNGKKARLNEDKYFYRRYDV